MPASEFWLLLAFGLLMVAAFYVPALRRRSRERTRQRERLEREAGQTSTGTSIAERAVPEVEAPEVEAPDVVPPPEKIAPPAPAPPAPAPAAPAPVAPGAAPPEIETPAPTAGRLVRLRARLSKSQNLFGKGLLALLSRDKLDEETWEEIEETLISADVGVEPTRQIVEGLRERARVLGTASATDLRGLLAEELVGALDPNVDRTLKATPQGDHPAVLLVVGVNGSGKTTTCGKIARVLVADGRSVVLGAADTFRAAAADQLATWAGRVGAEVVRGPEGGDPAAVAFDAVTAAESRGTDAVIVDTAGRLQTKVQLMAELAKIHRVIARRLPDQPRHVLLVLDATTGQNGLAQAEAFTREAGVTGIVLTKLDGTAKGGVAVAVADRLGVPIVFAGIGEEIDALAPFDPAAYAEWLLSG